MKKPFQHSGKDYEARSANIDGDLIIKVFGGDGHSLHSTTYAHEVLQDMDKVLISAGKTEGNLVDEAISEFKRSVDEGQIAG